MQLIHSFHNRNDNQEKYYITVVTIMTYLGLLIKRLCLYSNNLLNC